MACLLSVVESLLDVWSISQSGVSGEYVGLGKHDIRNNFTRPLDFLLPFVLIHAASTSVHPKLWANEIDAAIADLVASVGSQLVADLFLHALSTASLHIASHDKLSFVCC